MPKKDLFLAKKGKTIPEGVVNKPPLLVSTKNKKSWRATKNRGLSVSTKNNNSRRATKNWGLSLAPKIKISDGQKSHPRYKEIAIPKSRPGLGARLAMPSVDSSDISLVQTHWGGVLRGCP